MPDGPWTGMFPNTMLNVVVYLSLAHYVQTLFLIMKEMLTG